MNKLVYTDNLLSKLDSDKNYTKEDIEKILNDMQADYDKDIAKRRILNFHGLVDQCKLMDIVKVISDTNKPSLYD